MKTEILKKENTNFSHVRKIQYNDAELLLSCHFFNIVLKFDFILIVVGFTYYLKIYHVFK